MSHWESKWAYKYLNDIEKEFLEVVDKHRPELDKKVAEINRLIKEACDYSEECGVPFMCPAYDAVYIPKGYLSKYSQEMDNILSFEVMQPEYFREYLDWNGFEEWSLSSLGC